MLSLSRRVASRSAAAVARCSFSSSPRQVVLVDGGRIPFALSQTRYDDALAVDLARESMAGLLTKTGVKGSEVDYVLFGNVVMEPRTSNIAREAAMHAGIPKNVPAHTVTMACVSASAALCQGAEKILAGQADVVLAGGCETFSDVPIRYSRPIRKRLLKASKAMKKGPAALIGLARGLKTADLAPEAPQIANYTTGEVMGHSSDRLAAKFSVSRADQDAYALRSHRNAAKAHADGVYAQELMAGFGSPDLTENGIRGSTTEDQLAKLKPAFVKPHGTHTAANSSFLTDGAAAVIVAEQHKALAMGLRPKSIIRDFVFSAVDPFDELLLGPTYAISQLLQRNHLTLDMIDVIEMHEAFAGQVLANFAALGSDKFARENLPGRSARVGHVDVDKVNIHGGSLSLGHPFGATGARLVTTASNRLHAQQKRLALVAACADGGIGHACLIETFQHEAH